MRKDTIIFTGCLLGFISILLEFFYVGWNGLSGFLNL